MLAAVQNGLLDNARLTREPSLPPAVQDRSMSEPRKEPVLPPREPAMADAPLLAAEAGTLASPLVAEVRTPRPAPRRLWLRLLAGLLLLSLLPPAIVLALRWLPPPLTAFMLQSEVQPVRYQWVPASEIADVARRAVVAAEDQKFWMHEGFDFEAIEKALASNQKKNRRIRGASTISQQTAKNLFLWPGGGYFRKGVEATFTVLIEKFWGKERILEVYLNVAEFGPGIYGVEAAAQAHFGKPARRLTPDEAARLAAILPNPRRWSVSKPGPYVRKRSAWVLRQMGYGRPVAPVAGASADPEPLEPLTGFSQGVAPEAAPSQVPADPAPEPLPDAPEDFEDLEPEPPPPEPWPMPQP